MSNVSDKTLFHLNLKEAMTNLYHIKINIKIKQEESQPKNSSKKRAPFLTPLPMALEKNV